MQFQNIHSFLTGQGGVVGLAGSGETMEGKYGCKASDGERAKRRVSVPGAFR